MLKQITPDEQPNGGFEEWQAKRGTSFDWKTVSLKELNDILRKFYSEVKAKQGRTLSPSALTGMRDAVH